MSSANLDLLLKEHAQKMSHHARPSREEAEAAVRTLLRWAGENPDREGLRETPARVVASYGELFKGYKQHPEDVLSRSFEEMAGYQDMILAQGIPFHSYCEHHMVPFMGKVHIAYYPSKGVIGLSKLGHVVEIYARRFQTQEAMTAQICDALMHSLKPRGVAIHVEAEHLCMSMRGLCKSGVCVTTRQYAGVFQDDSHERQQFLMMLSQFPQK